MRSRRIVLAGLLAATAGGIAQPVRAQATVSRVTITPAVVSLPVSRREPLTALARDASGGVLRGVRYTWRTSAPGVATVDQHGLVSGVAPGTATVSVTVGEATATAEVTIRPGGGGKIVRVEIAPVASSVAKHSAVQLRGVAFDAQGRPSEAEWHLWNTDNPLVASVTSSGLVTGLAPGTARISMSSAGRSAVATVTVTGERTTNDIRVDTTVTFQTITGWQAEAQNGWLDCHPAAFARYRSQLYDRLVNELGINRLTSALRSGVEATKDAHVEYAAGAMPMSAYRQTWYSPENDNGDPMVTDTSKFFWSFFDGPVENAIIPVRERLQARGEQLYWVLLYVDFLHGRTTKPYLQMKAPEEYAELVVMAFIHAKQKFGFVPDALELVLEPEHTPYTPTDIGRAMVAVAARLRAHGFTPEILGPSTTSMWNAAPWYDAMTAVPGANGLLRELAYHRYVMTSNAALTAIGLRGLRDGVRTSMLEHIGSGFDDLYEDLTVGNVSAWMQYTSAFCGRRDNPANRGVYYQVNQTDPNNPKLNITNNSKLFRQVFAYVRRGAVRVRAESGNSTDLLPLAFRNANGRMVAVVRARRGASFAVHGLPAGTYGINYGTTTRGWNVNLPDQSIGAGEAIRTTIPSDGVLTVFAKP